MMSEHVTPKRFTASPVKRQFSEDLQDAPRGSLEAILSASGTNPLDPMYGEADAGLSTFSQVVQQVLTSQRHLSPQNWIL